MARASCTQFLVESVLRVCHNGTQPKKWDKLSRLPSRGGQRRMLVDYSGAQIFIC